MDHEVEYDDAMVKILELIWGEGFMAPGSTELVDKLVSGLRIQGKRVLDIGSGLGGSACYLAETYGALVTGIDIEPQLVELSNRKSKQSGLADTTEFILVEPGPLPFSEESFDIVLSAGAFTQIPDKSSMFTECLRVLTPGGKMHSFDWTTPNGVISDDLRYFFEVEDLSYALETPGTFERLLKTAGFTEVTASDDSEWYRRQSREEYELIKGTLYAQMVELLGSKDADHFVENWRAMAIVFEKGDLTQTICRSSKPERQ